MGFANFVAQFGIELWNDRVFMCGFGSINMAATICRQLLELASLF